MKTPITQKIYDLWLTIKGMGILILYAVLILFVSAIAYNPKMKEENCMARSCREHFKPVYVQSQCWCAEYPQ